MTIDAKFDAQLYAYKGGSVISDEVCVEYVLTAGAWVVLLFTVANETRDGTRYCPIAVINAVIIGRRSPSAMAVLLSYIAMPGLRTVYTLFLLMYVGYDGGCLPPWSIRTPQL